MDSNLDLDRDGLREQPLSADEKQLLSEYFQLEGKRQYDNYRTMLTLQYGRAPGDLFQFVNLPRETVEALSDKQLSLELAQRDHWINLIQTVHDRFYDDNPSLPEIEMWTQMAMEKHALVEIETGQEEYRKVLQFAQQRQTQLLAQLGEQVAKQYDKNLDLFYKLLEIDGIQKNLILFS